MGDAVDVNFDKKIRKDQACQLETKVCTKDQASRTEDVNRLKDLRDEIATLKKEIESLSKSISEASTKPKFDILNVRSRGKQVCFPESPDVSLDFVS